MRAPMFWVALTAIVPPLSGQSAAAQPKVAAKSPVHITIDTRNPELTLKLLSGQYSPEDVAQFKQLPGTLALIPKARTTWKMTITTDDLVKFIARARQGEKNNILAYDIAYEKRDEVTQLLRDLQTKHADVEETLSTALTPYIPAGKSLNLTFIPVLGGMSAGFTLGDAQTMYSGIHYFHGDYVGLRNMLLHEAFHNVQSMVEPNRTLDKCLSPQEQSAYDVLQTVFREGSAEYIADPWKQSPDAPYIKEEQDHLAINQKDWRYLNIEKLINYTTVSAMDSRGGPDPEVLSIILTDYFWNNPGYYFGYKSTGSLVKAYGQPRLASYLRSGAAQFFKDLLELQKSKGISNGFSPRFSEVVNTLAAKVAACPIAPENASK